MKDESWCESKAKYITEIQLKSMQIVEIHTHW